MAAGTVWFTLLGQARAAWPAMLAHYDEFLDPVDILAAFAVLNALFGLFFFCLWVIYRE